MIIRNLDCARVMTIENTLDYQDQLRVLIESTVDRDEYQHTFLTKDQIKLLIDHLTNLIK